MELLVLNLHLISIGGMNMKGRQSENKYKLGDLIAALFEEARRVTSDRVEQTILVYAALKDLLDGKVHSAHPITLRVPK
jgi:hypothetical protein